MDTQSHGTLYVFSGPSGVGKGTVLERVRKRLGDSVWQSVSATTRVPRKGETDGISYYFMTRDEFEQSVTDGGFLEWAEYAGNFYGTPRKYVEEHLSSGQDVILEIEVKGAMQVKAAMPSSVLVFIEPPSMDELMRRLTGRATESDEAIKSRLDTAIVEMSSKMEYDICFVNDSLKDTVNNICEFIENNRQSA